MADFLILYGILNRGVFSQSSDVKVDTEHSVKNI